MQSLTAFDFRRWIDELEGDGCEAAGGGSRARAVARLSDG